MPAAWILLALMIWCACVSACSSQPNDDTATNGAPGPVMPSAYVLVASPREAAEQEFEALDAGEWTDAWNLWTADAQKVISDEDFERVYIRCSPVTGVGFRIDKVRLVSSTKADVEWRRLNISGSHELRLEDNGWRFRPNEEELAQYRLGADALIKRKEREGTCG